MTPFADYLQHFALCRMPERTKSPLDRDWSQTPIQHIEPGYQYGIIHEYSHTCAIDIDDLTVARELFEQRGLNVDQYLSSGVQIVSGTPNRAKLIYRMPYILQSKKTKVDNKDVIDFRCKGMQDLLPGSIHPENNCYYIWYGRDWKDIPMLPQEIFDWWLSILHAPTLPTTEIPVIGQERAVALLDHCDPNCSRMDWIQTGMALHKLDEKYFVHWDTWSARSGEKYSGTQHNWQQWCSFKKRVDGITPRSLEYYARMGGWKPDLEAALALFKDESVDGDMEICLDQVPFPDIPLDLLPPVLKEYAIEKSKSVGSSPIVSIAAGLSAISTAIDGRSRLHITDDFAVPPVLWNMVVGSPSAKKSPASRPMMETFKHLEQEDIPRHKAAMLRYEAVEAAHIASKKEYLKMAGEGEFAMNNTDENGEIGEFELTQLGPVVNLPDYPKPLRFTMQDVTSQKLADLIGNRPEGMTLFLDEGASWIMKLVSQKSGEDRSMWVQSYEAQPYLFDRVSRGSIYVENLAIPIYMNLQPRLLEQNIDMLQTDGLLQRFMPFIIPTDEGHAVSDPVPAFISCAPKWDDLLRRIHASGKQEYTLSAGAYELFREFEKWIDTTVWRHEAIQSYHGLTSSIGKFAGMVGRIAMVFHAAMSPADPIVNELPMSNAIKFMKDYVYFSIQIMYAMSGEDSFDKWVFDWIITGEEETITESMVKRAARRPLQDKTAYHQNDMIHTTMQFLCTKNVLIEIETEQRRSNKYVVNPAVRLQYSDRRKKVARAKQAVLDSMRAIANQKSGNVQKRKARGYEN